MSEDFDGIKDKHKHDDSECQRVYVWRNTQRGAVQEAEQTEGPDDTEDCGEFHQVLLGQVVPRIQFKDEHVIHAGRAPSIYVYTHEEQELYDKQWPTIQSECYLQVVTRALMKYRCQEIYLNRFQNKH